MFHLRFSRIFFGSNPSSKEKLWNLIHHCDCDPNRGGGIFGNFGCEILPFRMTWLLNFGLFTFELFPLPLNFLALFLPLLIPEDLNVLFGTIICI